MGGLREQKSGDVVIRMNSVKYLVGSEVIDNRPMSPFNDAAYDFAGLLSDTLLHDKISKKYPDIITLAFWARRANILKLKEQYKEYLDRLGRGLVLHITPSNMPVNFAFSYLFSLLAGNANVVRVPSKPFPQIQLICDAITKIITSFPEIKDGTAFVSYPVDNDITASFSALADARIIWGGDSTIETIRSLKTKPRCVDVVFPDRYSICIINGETLPNAQDKLIKELAQAFYNDTYLIDQNACSSPSLVLWQNANNLAKERFWDAVFDLAIQKYDLQPAVSVDKYIQLCKDAVAYDTIASIKRSENVLYRVAFSSLPSGDLTRFRGKGGYFYEYDLQNLEELIPFINTKYQTITYFGLDSKNVKEIILKYRLRGIDRIVPVGTALDIGLTWDGYDLIDMLSREISAV
jgi:hypothetical protein